MESQVYTQRFVGTRPFRLQTKVNIVVLNIPQEPDDSDFSGDGDDPDFNEL